VIAPEPALAGVFDHGALAIACSGGSDSIALLHLAVAQAQGRPLYAVTVDHGLRPDSAAEAAFVAQVCNGLGVTHAVLRWQGPAERGNLLEQARQARLNLIGIWAQSQGIAAVALGHTADDQAEGFVMALQRKAGLAGLSGMRPRFRQAGVLWLRPLLAVPRQTLRDWLTTRALRWIDDPSNENDRFTRSRVRKALTQFAQLGVGAQQICGSVAHLAKAQAELDAHLGLFAATHLRETAGSLEIPRAALAQQPPGLVRRLMRAAILWISSADHPPRGPALDRFVAAALSGRDATLAGVRLRVGPQVLRLSREPRAIRSGQTLPWDGRWQFSGPLQGEIRPLGAEGLAQRPLWRDSRLPRDALLATPAVWLGTRLIAAPVLDQGETQATIRPGFNEFLIAH
jgi:tRNA(Ile)-lysidine synthase